MEGNGSYWEEQLHSRLWKARQWKEKLEYEIGLQQSALDKWAAYIQLLEQTLQLESELNLEAGLINGSAKAKSVTESLVVFALQKPEYTFTVKDAIDWLIEQGLYPDEKGAADSVYGIAAHRDDLFKRTDRATYRLTKKAISLGKSLTQPALIKVSGIPSREYPASRVHSPLSRFLQEALQEHDKTLQELKIEAQQKGMSFPGKHLGRVLHYALVGMTQNNLVERVNGTWRLKEGKFMICPACRRYKAAKAIDVARHMMGVFDELHTDCIEAEGLNPAELVKTGNYKLLADALSKAVKD